MREWRQPSVPPSYAPAGHLLPYGEGMLEIPFPCIVQGGRIGTKISVGACPYMIDFIENGRYGAQRGFDENIHDHGKALVP